MSQPIKQRVGFAPTEKWLLMTCVVLGLCGVVSWFNYRVFGWADGAPYFAIVGFIALMSLILVRHIKRSPVTSNFLKAAFVFEVAMTIVLGFNAVYSLSVQREMSIARQGETARKEELDSIGKLDRRAQRNVTQGMNREQRPALRSAQELFSDNERVLFIILMTELGVGLIGLFVLLGLSVFDKDFSGVPDFLESKPALPPAARSSLPAVGERPSIGERPLPTMASSTASPPSQALTPQRPPGSPPPGSREIPERTGAAGGRGDFEERMRMMRDRGGNSRPND